MNKNELAKHLIFLEGRLFPVTKKDLRELAFQLAEKNKVPHKFNKETEMAGYQWAGNFLKGNPGISFRIRGLLELEQWNLTDPL